MTFPTDKQVNDIARMLGFEVENSTVKEIIIRWEKMRNDADLVEYTMNTSNWLNFFNQCNKYKDIIPGQTCPHCYSTSIIKSTEFKGWFSCLNCGTLFRD